MEAHTTRGLGETVETLRQTTPVKILEEKLEATRKATRGNLTFTIAGILLTVYLVIFYWLGSGASTQDDDNSQRQQDVVAIRSSLNLNLTIFGVCMVWWLIEPITSLSHTARFIYKCCMRRKDKKYIGGAMNEPLMEDIEGLVSEKKSKFKRKMSKAFAQSPVLTNTSICNYLMFLQVNVYIFFALAILEFIFSLFDDEADMWSGLIPKYVLKAGEENILESQMTLQIVKWIAHGIVILAGVQLINGCVQHTVVDENHNKKIARTLWIQGLPARDHQTGAPFYLDAEHFKEVRTALVRSINERFLEHSGEGYQISWTNAELFDAIEELTSRGYTIRSEKDKRYHQALKADVEAASKIDGDQRVHVETEEGDSRRAMLTGIAKTAGTAKVMKKFVHRLRQRQEDVSREEEFLAINSAHAHSLEKNSVIEECEVVPVLDKWEIVHNKLKQVVDYKDEYNRRVDEIRSQLADYQADSCWSRYRRRKLVRKQEQYERYAADYLKSEQDLQKMLKEHDTGLKQLSGSAFVTFKEFVPSSGVEPELKGKNLCEDMLNTHCCEERKFSLRTIAGILWDSILRPQGYSYFKFGRPPFASVTLRCSQAPPPSDIQWKNLHVSEAQSRVISGIVGFLMVVVLFILILPAWISVSTNNLVDSMVKDAEMARNMTHSQLLSNETAYMLEDIIDTFNGTIVDGFRHQGPTILLTVVNTGILPSAIEFIGNVGRSHQTSFFEVDQKQMNYWMMVWITLVMPLLGLAGSAVTGSQIATHVRDLISTKKFEGLLTDPTSTFEQMGPYAMKYLLNAAFLSSMTQLLDISQWIIRQISMPLAKTQKERDELNIPWPFAWGYWYGYSMAIITLTAFMGIIVPSVFPMTAVFFYMKFMVDRYNLIHKVYETSTELGGRLLITAVRDMRMLTGVIWLLEGSMLMALLRSRSREREGGGEQKSEGKYLFYGFALMMIAVGIIVMIWATSAHTYQRMALSAKGNSKQIKQRWNRLRSFCSCGLDLTEGTFIVQLLNQPDEEGMDVNGVTNAISGVRSRRMRWPAGSEEKPSVFNVGDKIEYLYTRYPQQWVSAEVIAHEPKGIPIAIGRFLGLPTFIGEDQLDRPEHTDELHWHGAANLGLMDRDNH